MKIKLTFIFLALSFVCGVLYASNNASPAVPNDIQFPRESKRSSSKRNRGVFLPREAVLENDPSKVAGNEEGDEADEKAEDKADDDGYLSEDLDAENDKNNPIMSLAKEYAKAEGKNIMIVHIGAYESKTPMGKKTRSIWHLSEFKYIAEHHCVVIAVEAYAPSHINRRGVIKTDETRYGAYINGQSIVRNAKASSGNQFKVKCSEISNLIHMCKENFLIVLDKNDNVIFSTSIGPKTKRSKFMEYLNDSLEKLSDTPKVKEKQ